MKKFLSTAAIEYGLIAAGISVAIIAVAPTVAKPIARFFGFG